jgi:hypothetical protein
MVSNVKKDRSELGHLISQIKGLLQSGQQILVVKIPRSQNKASDALAPFGRTSDRTSLWLVLGRMRSSISSLGIVILMFK